MRLAGPSKSIRCNAHYTCGLQMLANRDRKRACEQLVESVQMGQYNWSEYNWSSAFLKRMDHG